MTFGSVKKNTRAAIAFGKVLQKYREREGLSKHQLAYESEIGIRTITRLENGESGVGLHVLFALADALNVQASELIKQTEILLNDA